MILDTKSYTKTMENAFNLENAIKATKIYFNESLHKYTDEFDNPYTSTTIIIDKYMVKFDAKTMSVACEKIGRNPKHPKYLKYKGKKAWQIEQDWLLTGKIACDNGNTKHSFLELGVKGSNGYNDYLKDVPEFINGTKGIKLLTINDVINNHSFGRISLDKLALTGIKERYPKIYKAIEHFTLQGYYIYSELGVYDCERLVSGCIDLILINFDTKEFIIIDWKTNRQDIRFDSGYFEKDIHGKDTTNWIATNQICKPPLATLASSTGNKYTLQLSTYAYLVELRGFTCKNIILYQIRESELENDLEVVNGIIIKYFKGHVEMMINDHYNVSKKSHKLQMNLFL